MKNSSSLNVRMRELFPLVINSSITPAVIPYQGES